MDKLSYSIEEASTLSGIGRTKIYEAINLNQLKARKFGKRTLILKSDLEEFLAKLSPYNPVDQYNPQDHGVF